MSRPAVLLRPALLVLGLAALLLTTAGPAAADTNAGGARTAVAIIDFSYRDTSDEPADQVAAHERRLAALMTALRRDFAASGPFDLVPVSCGATACTDNGVAPEDLIGAAAQAGARILVLGGIQKLSTLIQWAKVQAIDIAADRVVFDKLYTFRGDNDEAWERARAFIVRDLQGALAAQAGEAPAVGAAAPVRLALFRFELEDMSAAGSSTGEAPADAAQLESMTADVGKLLAGSGRYVLVDVSGAQDEAATGHALHDCDGCDAPIALQLGAAQSFVGVVRRISRTEYTVRFGVRDARTGAVVAAADSGLRMGADYSWGRGAIRLIKDRLLETAGKP